MPVMPLAPFVTYDPTHFRLGGSPETLHAAATRWRSFGEAALDAAAKMRSINDGGFIGTEGDRFRELVNADFPKNLTTTGNSHVGVANAIAHYATALRGFKSEMRAVRSSARVHHAEVQAAAAEVNAAELAAVGTGGAAAPEVALAMAKYNAAKIAWEGDILAADRIKDALGGEVRAQAAAIAQETKERFEENPNKFQQAWDSLSNFMREHADILTLLSDALQIIGSLLMFVCPILGAVILGLGVALKMLLAASGACSWGEALFDLATAGPLGLIGKAAKAGKYGSKIANAANKMSGIGDKAMSGVKSAAGKAANKAALKSADGIKALANENTAKSFYSKITRGKEICFAAEPVDMATGNMVDFKTDVFIEGILPLTVDRNANTNHELGRALGPRWVSTMDVRIEICDVEVLMLSPDGALLTFPPAPVDGSEVRADGRPWLMSYADGEYRVRNIAAGLTYVFRLFDSTSDREATSTVGVEDRSPSLGGSYVAATIPAGSLADTFGMGIGVGLSSVVHHTGAAIDYTWDNSSGHMVRMRRSDDTILDLSWDTTVGRVAAIHVSNPSTHPGEEPLRLISYEYDPQGQLIRVVNSNDGALKYHYDEAGRMYAWTDRNDASYYYRFDEHGRVHSQVGTGGMFPNILYWGEDRGDDAPLGGGVCVLIETAGEFKGDPHTLGDSVVEEYLDRLEQLPLYQALVEGGLEGAGLTGRGRAGERDDVSWTVPEEWLHDDYLGDIRPTVYRSTPSGDVWRIVSPEGDAEDSAYNAYHQQISVTNSAEATALYGFNDDGVLVSTELPNGLQARIEPGAWGKPARLIGSDGLTTEYVINQFGLIEAIDTPAGETTTFSYDPRPSGFVLESTTYPDGTTYRHENDDAGRVVATIDPSERRMTSTRDVRGLVTEMMDPVGAITTIEYTPEGWISKVTYPDDSTISAAYDGEGNKVATTNEIGATTTAKYTVFDKPVASIDPTGAVTRLEYNTQMQPVRLINADDRVWSYSYDLNGAVRSETDYNRIVTMKERSTDGLTDTTISPAGVTTLARHADGRTHTISDDLGTTTYHYDASCRIERIEGPQATIVYDRDPFGRATSETVILPSGEATTLATQIEYPTGRISEESVTLPLGDIFSTRYHVDQAGQLEATTHSKSKAGSQVSECLAEIKYALDERGLRNRYSTGALVRNMENDSRGRIVADTLSALDSAHPLGMRTISSRLCTWRDDGALASVTDFLRGAINFDLDLLGRVTGVRRGPGHPTTRESNAINPRTSIGDESYEFSAAGVLTAIGTPTRSTPTSSFEEDKPAAREVEAPGHTARGGTDDRIELHGTMPTRVGRTTYTYDAAGRITQTVTRRPSKKPLVHNFYYATGAQPIGFTSSDEPNVGYRYSYDPYGRRVAKEKLRKDTGEVLSRTVFAYSGNQLVAEQVSYESTGKAGSGYVWTTDPETGELSGQIDISPSVAGFFDRDTPIETDAEFSLIMTDLAGSPQEIVDPSNGEITGYSTQTLYGVRSWYGDHSSPLLFTGQYLDQESGWAYNRFRYYQPNAGVYNAQDPLGVTPRSASAQGYVDHAAHWVDPLGLNGHTKFAGKTITATVDGHTISIKMTSYTPLSSGGGHHTPMKAMINGTTGAKTLQDMAPAVPLDELQKLNVLDQFKHPDGKGMTGKEIHDKITQAQQEVFRGEDKSKIKTWADAGKVDLKAHTMAGIPEEFAKPMIQEGIKFYIANGVTKPTNFPWGGKIV